MQQTVVFAPQQQIYIEAGRGTGKTVMIAIRMLELVMQMPRGTFLIVGQTYSQILSKFLPEIKQTLEMFGVFEDVDYVVGSSKGKKMGYKMPFGSPDTFHNVIHFSNGSIFQLVSLEHKDSGRGLNSYAIIGDEAGLMDGDKLSINVRNTNRAIKEIFKKSKLLNSELFVSSTPLTKKGKWFVDMENESLKEPKKILFLKATAKINLHNVRPDYFEYMKRSYSSELIYNAEMLNIRPKEIADGFYPQLTPNHYYTNFNNDYLEALDLGGLHKSSFNCRQDNDINPNLPLLMSVDWGAAINSMVISQLQNDTYRVLKSFWVKTPKILDHLFLEEFIPYYEPFPNKVIKFYYDRVGNSKTANSKHTYAQQAAKLLRNAGWKVHEMTVGSNPNHMDKFRLINVALREDGRGNLPKIRINSSNCSDLIVSMENAEARDTSRGLEKDKRSETRKSVEQQHATHLSDAFDYPFFQLFNEKFVNSNRSTVDTPISTF